MAPAAVKFDPSNVFCIPNISITVDIKASSVFIGTSSNNISTRKAFKSLAFFNAIVIMAKVVAVEGCLHNPSANRNPNHFAVHHVPA